MGLKSLLGRKTAAILVVGIVGLGVAGCAPKPTTTNTAGPQASGAPSDAFLSGLLSAVNADRAGAGLPGFSWNSMLASNAAAWAKQMSAANSLYHQNLSALLSSPSYAGFSTLGENILVGPGNMSPTDIEASWKASPPHWANITNRAFTTIGIGYFRGPDGRIWATQEFGG
jgi:uncharacterized protein YkwD